MSGAPYSAAEQMVCCASRLIRNDDVIYVGVGLPTAAALLAKHLHAPDAWVILETGIVRAGLFELPLGVDTLATQAGADALADVLYINALAQRGRVTLGFIGGGQVDRHGNVNSNAIGDYRNPTYRFPGCGGGNDIASFCPRVVVLMPQKKTRFPARVDFVSCPGFLDGSPAARRDAGLPDGGPVAVISDLAVFGARDGELVLREVHRELGATEDTVRANVGWELRAGDAVTATAPPTVEELRVLREQVDPQRRVISGGLIA